ncbi:hypothetical protein JRO89_XS02G0114400 [Xanthoceras sorbifolium]|uniref:Uncharacterized protein n=1 Tax=Xanthoceras sorbifolium TaxID=99658 RepID=A0ABQ8IFL3_9ROSI|nr:hypothetical protein JRO89_XS02G0114400 [Xanthoceras sorbifolium]
MFSMQIQRYSLVVIGKMKAFFTLSTICLLLLFANTIDGRKDLQEYWRITMKDQPMPESIRGLIRDVKPTEEKTNVKIFDPKPRTYLYQDDQLPIKEKTFSKNFDPKPRTYLYQDGITDQLQTKEKSFVKDFNPKPRAYFYQDDINDQIPTKKNTFVKEFDPKPRTYFYQDGISDQLPSKETTFVKDFDPKARTYLYQDDNVQDKNFVKELIQSPVRIFTKMVFDQLPT